MFKKLPRGVLISENGEKLEIVLAIPTRVDITVYQNGKCFMFLKYLVKLICRK